MKKYILLIVLLIFSTIYEHLSSWMHTNFSKFKINGITAKHLLTPSILKHDMAFLAICSTAFIVIPVIIAIWMKRNNIRVKHKFSFRIPMFVLFAVSMLVQVYVLVNVNKGFALSGDENAYLFQAKIFSDGALTVPSHPLKEFFNNDHIVNNGRMFSIYPPGVPFLLYVAMLISGPWLMGPLFASASLFLFYIIFKKHTQPHIAFLAVCSIALSGFFITFGASYHSHPPALFFTLLAIFLYEKMESDGKGGLYFGAAFGMSFIIRPLTASFLIFALIIEVGFNWTIKQQRNAKIKNILCLKNITKAAFGFLPFFAIFCAYNYHLTGNILKMGYMVSDDVQFIGFHDNLIFALKSILYTCWRLFDNLFAIPTGVGLFFTALGVYKAGKNGRRYFFILLSSIVVCSSMCFHQFRYFYSFAFFLHIYVFIGFDFFINKLVNHNRQVDMVCSQWLMTLSAVFGILAFSNAVRIKKRWLEKVRTPYNVVEKKKLGKSIVFLNSTSYVYPTFYARNSPKLNDKVLYVLDLGNKNKEIIKYYGKRRSFFMYKCGELKRL